LKYPNGNSNHSKKIRIPSMKIRTIRMWF